MRVCPQEPASESSDGKLHGAPAMTDSEGTTASAEEINASMKQAFVRIFLPSAVSIPHVIAR